MAKIQYENKVALLENADIPDINKITDDDMNEIKQVVNENDDKFLTNGLNVSNEVDEDYRVNVLHSKNLLPNNSSTITTNGITFTKNSDGSITINGTSTARADLYIFGGTTDNGNYLKIKKGTYSFDRSNLTDGKIFFAFREKTAGTKYETLTNNDAIETMATQDCYFYGVMIGVESGNTINNLTIYPMLNEGNTLLPYEPYITPSINVDGEEIYQQEKWKTVDYTDYITFNSVVSRINSVVAVKKGNELQLSIDILATISQGLTKLGVFTKPLLIQSFGAARFANASNVLNTASFQIASSGQFNIYTSEAGERCAGTIRAIINE